MKPMINLRFRLKVYSASLVAAVVLVLAATGKCADAQLQSKPKGQHPQKVIVDPMYISGIKYIPPAQEKIIAQQARPEERLIHSADVDMQVHDYPSAVRKYQQLLQEYPFSQFYSYDLAYAFIGVGRKAAALNVLHELFYHNGNTLFTSGLLMKPYMTYALLEDEAGNWKEAALAYNLAGGGPRGKYFNGVWPTVSMNFTPNHPQATLLAAAANVMLGKCSWDAHLNETGNAALSDALAYMRTATGLEPNWPVGWFYLHLVLKAAGHHHQADVAYHRALSLAGSLDNLFALGRPPVMPQPTIAVTKQ